MYCCKEWLNIGMDTSESGLLVPKLQFGNGDCTGNSVSHIKYALKKILRTILDYS